MNVSRIWVLLLGVCLFAGCAHPGVNKSGLQYPDVQYSEPAKK